MRKTISILFLFFSTFVLSQSVTGESELSEDYKKADKELNSVYNEIIKKLNETDKKNLIKAQKAWLKFRDLNCKFKSQDPVDGGGPYENKMKLDCLIQSTEERTKELAASI
jgi:uncharacterized protein YecT (DUF1311 family)